MAVYSNWEHTTAGGEYATNWWIRSSSAEMERGDFAAIITDYGDIAYAFYFGKSGVRPALRLDLSRFFR